MEVLNQELEAAGYSIHVVAINYAASAGYQDNLAQACTFDVLQDEESVDAFGLLGGLVDDFFIFREGGRLAPGGYLPKAETNLTDPETYENVRSRIIEACELGPGEDCPGIAEPGSGQVIGDLNQDSSLDISDVVSILAALFRGDGGELPCGDGSFQDEGNRTLLDVNDDQEADISDAVYLLNYLFLGGAAPAAGIECVPVAGCPDACAG